LLLFDSCGQLSYLSGFAVPTTGRTPERRARVAADPVQRFVMRRRVTHDFRAEQQFSRKDFFERQRHHTSTEKVNKKSTHARVTARRTTDRDESRFEHVRRHLRKRKKRKPNRTTIIHRRK